MVKTGSGDCVDVPSHCQFTVKSDPRSRTASTCWIVLESIHSDTSCVAMVKSKLVVLCMMITASLSSVVKSTFSTIRLYHAYYDVMIHNMNIC